MKKMAKAVYRTEDADRWISLVPVTVRAITDFLPTTSILELLTQAIIDADMPKHPQADLEQ